MKGNSYEENFPVYEILNENDVNKHTENKQIGEEAKLREKVTTR